MRMLSVNVGLPREVEWRNEPVTTAIHKAAVSGPVRVRRLNLDGDRQADLSVHGGPDKAVYVYPSEHYPFWKEELPGVALPWGAFGENLTVEGVNETAVRVGDVLRAGTAEFIVTQPRLPCYKLNIRFQRPDMVKRFLRSGRTGFLPGCYKGRRARRRRRNRAAPHRPLRGHHTRSRYPVYVKEGRQCAVAACHRDPCPAPILARVLPEAIILSGRARAILPCAQTDNTRRSVLDQDRVRISRN